MRPNQQVKSNFHHPPSQRLRSLREMLQAGLITREELDRLKGKILDGSGCRTPLQ